MKQFKDLTVEEKLDLIEYYLRGGTILFGNDPDKQSKLSYGKEGDILFVDKMCYQKDTTKLNNLYKELSSLKEQIAQEESLLGASPQGDITLPIQSPSEEDKTSEKGSHVAESGLFNGSVPVKERITLENWKSLGIKVGDKVEVIGGRYFPMGDYLVEDIDREDYLSRDFLFLRNIKDDWVTWMLYSSDTEMYLIRTEEGSL